LREAAVLLGFGFVFAQSQATAGMFLRSSLAKMPKSPAAERLRTPQKRGLSSRVINSMFRRLTVKTTGHIVRQKAHKEKGEYHK
jgi:hypothetical protein